VTETTGLYHEHEIIQLSFCIEKEEGGFTDVYDLKMQPYDFDIIQDRALAVNNLNRETIKNFDTPEVAMGKLLGVINEYKSDYYNRLVLGGYNTCFDVYKLVNFFARVYNPKHDLSPGYDKYYKEFYKYFQNRRIDVMCLIPLIEKSIGKQFRAHKLSDIYEFFFPNEKMNWHNATTDVLATIKLYKLFISRFGIK